MKILLIIGAPGAGKGTIANELTKELSLKSVSTGDILRSEIASGSKKGKVISGLIDEGNFVPDEMVNEIIVDYLKRDFEEEYLLLDGYPRTVEQAKFLNKELIKDNNKVYKTIHLNPDKNILKERVINRRLCGNCKEIYHLENFPPKKEDICDICGEALTQREDDSEKSFNKRIEIYKEKTYPVLNEFDAILELNNLSLSKNMRSIIGMLSEYISVEIGDIDTDVDELILNPDEVGFLIMIKTNQGYCYVGKNNKKIKLKNKLPMHIDYDYLNKLVLFEDDGDSGVLDTFKEYEKIFDTVYLLSVFRDNGDTIIESDDTEAYRNIDLI